MVNLRSAVKLFKMYKKNPEEFNVNYIAYLSAGNTITPDKLKRFFNIGIDRKLFEEAMDMVQIRVEQLQQIESEMNLSAQGQQQTGNRNKI